MTKILASTTAPTPDPKASFVACSGTWAVLADVTSQDLQGKTLQVGNNFLADWIVYEATSGQWAMAGSLTGEDPICDLAKFAPASVVQQWDYDIGGQLGQNCTLA